MRQVAVQAAEEVVEVELEQAQPLRFMILNKMNYNQDIRLN
jgi:hypothetical protein